MTGTTGKLSAIHAIADRVALQIDSLYENSSEQRDKLQALYDVVTDISKAASANTSLAGSTATGAGELAALALGLLERIDSFTGYVTKEPPRPELEQ